MIDIRLLLVRETLFTLTQLQSGLDWLVVKWIPILENILPSTMDGKPELTASLRLVQTYPSNAYILTRVFSILLKSTITTRVMRQTLLWRTSGSAPLNLRSSTLLCTPTTTRNWFTSVKVTFRVTLSGKWMTMLVLIISGILSLLTKLIRLALPAETFCWEVSSSTNQKLPNLVSTSLIHATTFTTRPGLASDHCVSWTPRIKKLPNFTNQRILRS